MLIWINKLLKSLRPCQIYLFQPMHSSEEIYKELAVEIQFKNIRPIEQLTPNLTCLINPAETHKQPI